MRVFDHLLPLNSSLHTFLDSTMRKLVAKLALSSLNEANLDPTKPVSVVHEGISNNSRVFENSISNSIVNHVYKRTYYGQVLLSLAPALMCACSQTCEKHNICIAFGV